MAYTETYKLQDFLEFLYDENMKIAPERFSAIIAAFHARDVICKFCGGQDWVIIKEPVRQCYHCGYERNK